MRTKLIKSVIPALAVAGLLVPATSDARPRTPLTPKAVAKAPQKANPYIKGKTGRLSFSVRARPR